MRVFDGVDGVPVADFFAFADDPNFRGGGDVGVYLTQHASISHVHITGSESTFRAIVWGTGDAGEARRRAGGPGGRGARRRG